MLDLFLFFICIIFGWILRNTLSREIIRLIKHCSYYILLTFITASIWKYGIPQHSWSLLLVGMLLVLIPSLLGIFFTSKSLRRDFLIFSTYGGGNRGTLALSILAPTLLPLFVLIDLGNFFALILFYPAIVKKGLIDSKGKKHLNTNYVPFLISLFAVVVGTGLHYLIKTAEINSIYNTVKIFLIIFTSFQIGTHLTLSSECYKWALCGLLKVRLIVLILLVLLTITIFEDYARNIITVLLLFSILPVSSLAISLIPTGTSPKFKQSISCATTTTTSVFFIFLFIIIITNIFF